mgnify:CR=1
MTSSSDHFLADLERARVLSLQEQVYPTANADPSPQTGGGSKDLAPAVLEQARLHWVRVLLCAGSRESSIYNVVIACVYLLFRAGFGFGASLCVRILCSDTVKSDGG